MVCRLRSPTQTHTSPRRHSLPPRVARTPGGWQDGHQPSARRQGNRSIDARRSASTGSILPPQTSFAPMHASACERAGGPGASSPRAWSRAARASRSLHQPLRGHTQISGMRTDSSSLQRRQGADKPPIRRRCAAIGCEQGRYAESTVRCTDEVLLGSASGPPGTISLARTGTGPAKELKGGHCRDGSSHLLSHPTSIFTVLRHSSQ